MWEEVFRRFGKENSAMNATDFYAAETQQSKVYPCANSVMTRWYVFQLSKPSCLTNITTNHASQ